MNQSNLIETIKKDLDFASNWFANMTEGEPICQDELDTISDILGHLRALLEENAALRKSRDIEIKEADAVRKQLQQTREELAEVDAKWVRCNDNWMRSMEHNARLEKELEQVKAQRDELKSLYGDKCRDWGRVVDERYRMERELEQVKAERDTLQEAYDAEQMNAADAIAERNDLQAELERLKAPIAGHPTPEEIKDMLIFHAPTPVQKVVDHFEALMQELAQARSELSAKDKVLEWYADDRNYIGMLDGSSNLHVDGGLQAKDILSQYPPRREEP